MSKTIALTTFIPLFLIGVIDRGIFIDHNLKHIRTYFNSNLILKNS